MHWRSKRALAEPVPSFDDAGKPMPSPEAMLSNALREYQEHFASSINSGPDAEAEAATALIDRAKEIVGSSGLGAALAPTLLDHIQHWPTWSQRDDFEKWKGFPAGNVSGSSERSEKGVQTSKIVFTYKSRSYGVIFINEGGNNWISDDMNLYGKVGLVHDNQTVLGLNIARNISKEYERWRWHGVFAFRTGDWMKDLIEMAAYIEAASQASSRNFHDKDALERAKNIKL
jgi:hypothetical protein